MKEEDKIVYTYLWKGLITVTRVASGKWFTEYNRNELVERWNKNNPNEPVVQGYNENYLQLLETFAVTRDRLTNWCKRSYGDKVELENFGHE